MNSRLLFVFPLVITLGQSVFAQDRDLPFPPTDEWSAPWWQSHGGQPLLRPASYRAEGQAALQIEVFYPGKQDVSTIDSEDVWVVSKNGYNALAALVEAEPANFWPGFDPDEWPEDLLGEDGEFIDPAVFGFEEQQGVVATYQISPADPESTWTAADNDEHVVLLEPRQVLHYGTRFYEAARLGALRVAIGEPEPVAPRASAEVAATYPLGEAITFTVTYTDENGLVPESIGNDDIHVLPLTDDLDQPWLAEFFYGNQARLLSAEFTEDNKRAVATYEIVSAWSDFGWAEDGTTVGMAPFPGSYRLEMAANSVCDVDRLCVGAQTLGEFAVVGDLQAPSAPETTLSVTKDRRGYYARVGLELERGSFVSDWGRPVLKGNTYMIDLKLNQLPSIEGMDWEPLGLFGFGSDYNYALGAPTPGKYEVLVRYDGEVLATTDFKAEEIDPNDIPIPDAEIEVIHEFGNYAAYLHVGLDGETWVTDWGTPRLEDDSTYRIDIDLSIFTDHFDPDVLGVDGIPFAEPHHLYDLGQPEPGDYTIAVYYKDQLVTSAEFEAEEKQHEISTRLLAEPLTLAQSAPYQFTINWIAGPDPNIEHLKTALVRVNRIEGQPFQSEARIVDVAVAESFPPQVMIRYEASGPNAVWDERANGVYEVSYLLVPEGVDPAVVRVASVSVGMFEVLVGGDVDPTLEPNPVDPAVGEPGSDDGRGEAVFEFADWLGAMAGKEEQRWASPGAASADPDADGLSNWEEYAFGTDPFDGRSQAQPRPVLMDADGAKHLAIHFQHALGAVVVPTVMVSDNLLDWHDASEMVDFEVIGTTDGNREVVACLKESVEESSFRYVRMVLPEAP